MYFGIKEGRHAEKEIQAWRDCCQAEAGGCTGLAGPEHGGRYPL